jgi:hypothetical protein
VLVTSNPRVSETDLSKQIEPRNKQQPLSTSTPPGLQRRLTEYPDTVSQQEFSQERHASQADSIYIDLIKLEKECVDVDTQLQSNPSLEIMSDEWHYLLALHFGLLRCYEDYFMCSRDPSTSPELEPTELEHDLLENIWKHGMVKFLIVCFHRLPQSLKYIELYTNRAYSLFESLLGTVSEFELIWCEHLGRIARYRAIITAKDYYDRIIWTSVSRFWYSKAADINPYIGRFHLNLARLAPDNSLQQFSTFGKCLMSGELHPDARRYLLVSIFHRHDLSQSPYPRSANQAFVDLHASILRGDATETILMHRPTLLQSIDDHIEVAMEGWKDEGIEVAIASIFGWFDYGRDLNPLHHLLLLRNKQRVDPKYQVEQNEEILQPDIYQLRSPAPGEQRKYCEETLVDQRKPRIPQHKLPTSLYSLQRNTTFNMASLLAKQIFAVVLQRSGNLNVLPYVHIILAFLYTLALIDCASHLVNDSPWSELVNYLNVLAQNESQKSEWLSIHSLIQQPLFPTASTRNAVLPEDYHMRGLLWAKEYIPPSWFNVRDEEEDRCLESERTYRERVWRVLRLGYRLADVSPLFFVLDLC